MTKSLRNMDFEELSIYYEGLFGDIIGINIFEKINSSYRSKYQKFIRYKNKGYKFISYVGLYGEDKKHDFEYDHEKKYISIIGTKSTNPDIEINLKNGKKFLLELKTASKNIFTIKKGNVESLYSSVAKSNRFCLIMMLDLNKGLYEIKDLSYFENQNPFSNANMEGQICYNFPEPIFEIRDLLSIDLNIYANMLILQNIWVKKFKLLYIAMNKDEKKRQKIIKNKIKVERLKEELNFSTKMFKEKINIIENKFPEVKYKWEYIEDKINLL